MNNTNIKHLQIIKNSELYINPIFYKEEQNKKIKQEKFFIKNIDKLDEMIDYLETQIDNPDEWINFEEAMDEIRMDILNG